MYIVIQLCAPPEKDAAIGISRIVQYSILFRGLQNLFPGRLSQSEHKRRVAVPSQPGGMRLGGMVHTASGTLR
jgi:hypothetical protein